MPQMPKYKEDEEQNTGEDVWQLTAICIFTYRMGVCVCVFCPWVSTSTVGRADGLSVLSSVCVCTVCDSLSAGSAGDPRASIAVGQHLQGHTCTGERGGQFSTQGQVSMQG